MYQEPSCPPRLQDDTKRTGGILTGLALFELNEIFSVSLKYIYEVNNILSKHVRNHPVLQVKTLD